MKLDPKYQAKIANPRGFLRYTKKSVPQRYVNNILVNDAEENDDDAAEQLGNDIRSMIKTGTGKQEDFDEGEEKNVGDLMQDMAQWLKMPPKCFDFRKRIFDEQKRKNVQKKRKNNEKNI